MNFLEFFQKSAVYFVIAFFLIYIVIELRKRWLKEKLNLNKIERRLKKNGTEQNNTTNFGNLEESTNSRN